MKARRCACSRSIGGGVHLRRRRPADSRRGRGPRQDCRRGRRARRHRRAAGVHDGRPGRRGRRARGAGARRSDDRADQPGPGPQPGVAAVQPERGDGHRVRGGGRLQHRPVTRAVPRRRLHGRRGDHARFAPGRPGCADRRRQRSGGSAGRGYLLLSQSKFNSPWGYSINQRSYLSARLLGHEMGHNLGLSHDRANTSPGSSFLPYAYGYQVPNVFYTIMAYPCLFCRGIDYYSNPAVFVDGQPTGIADFADEARALRENFPTVAGFRGCPSQVTDFEEAPAEGGPFRFTIQTPAGCPWNVSVSSVDTWVTPPRTATGLGSATIWLLAAPLPAISGGRSTFVFVDGQTYRIDQRPRVDTDGDGLPDAWESALRSRSGVHRRHNGGERRPRRRRRDQRAGVRRRHAPARPLHALPRRRRARTPSSTRGSRCSTRRRAPARVLRPLPASRAAPPSRTADVAAAGRRRLTVDAETIAGVESPTSRRSIESDRADRGRSDDDVGRSGYGSHAETALPSPATTWYLAEGSTSGDFALFYLLQNPHAEPVSVDGPLPAAARPAADRDATYASRADSRDDNRGRRRRRRSWRPPTCRR